MNQVDRDSIAATEQIAKVTAERDEARRMLARCTQISGADCDGNDPEGSGYIYLWQEAVEQVRQLRKDYDESGAEVAELRARLNRLERERSHKPSPAVPGQPKTARVLGIRKVTEPTCCLCKERGGVQFIEPIKKYLHPYCAPAYQILEATKFAEGGQK